MRKIRRLAAALVIFSAACASQKPAQKEDAAPGAVPSTPAPELSVSPAPKFDLQETLARELEPIPPTVFRAPDGSFEGSIEAKGAPTFKAGQAPAEWEIPLGTTEDVHCYVYLQRIDAAASITNIAAGIRKAAELIALRPVDVVALNGAPVIFAEIDYAQKVQGGRAVGQLKLAVRVTDELSFLCAHDEPGYTQSFRRLMTGFFSSVTPLLPPEGPQPSFEELQIMRLNDKPVGFAVRRLFRQAPGHREDAWNSMLLMRSTTDAIGSDSFTRETVGRDGKLTEVMYVKAVNGEEDANVVLKQTKEGYAYEGTWEQKPISGVIAAKPMDGDVAHWKKVKGLLAGKKDELSIESYSPSTDPTKAMMVKYRKSPGTPRGLQIEMGPLKFTGSADAQGVMERSEMNMGRLKVVAERAWSKGAP